MFEPQPFKPAFTRYEVDMLFCSDAIKKELHRLYSVVEKSIEFATKTRNDNKPCDYEVEGNNGGEGKRCADSAWRFLGMIGRM